MQSLISRYAALIVDAVRNGASKDFVPKVVAYMKAHGHLSVLPAVLKKVERMGAASYDAVVTLADAADAKTFAPRIASALATLGAEDDYSVAVDTNMVGGYSVRAKNKVIDQSYRKALVDLYQKITN